MVLTREGESQAQVDREVSSRWSLTREALGRLLRRLGEEPEKAAREYEAIRRGLLVFFEMRGFANAEALADEAIDRVARRIEGGERVEHPRAYVYGVARKLALEAEKHRARERAAMEAHRALQVVEDAPEAVEARVVCLERCLQKLPPQSRALIVSYYQGSGGAHVEGRRLLAERLGISYTSLKTRAHRIRNALEPCLHECLETSGRGNR
jgi:DNA-directed RNA polymerase specialized sigma24 family protein